MDRYEFNLKLEQLKKMIDKKDYATAAKIADTVEWDRVRSNSILELVAEVYEINREYAKAKEILLIEYGRVTLGRRIAYRLAVLSARLGQVREAEGYYNDFVTMSPLDNSKYLLRYTIEEAKGKPVNELLKYIETYLQGDMDDKWAYILAAMYHKCGMGDKCADMCGSIILWFGDGPYVEKARKLQAIYRPHSHDAHIEKEKEILRETWSVPAAEEEDEVKPEDGTVPSDNAEEYREAPEPTDAVYSDTNETVVEEQEKWDAPGDSQWDSPKKNPDENSITDSVYSDDSDYARPRFNAEDIYTNNRDTNDIAANDIDVNDIDKNDVIEDNDIGDNDIEDTDIEDIDNIDIDDIRIKTYDADNKYNTFNIQAEIARSMSVLMSDAYYDENYNDPDIINEPTKEVGLRSKIAKVPAVPKAERIAETEAEQIAPDKNPIAPLYELEGDGQIGIYIDKNRTKRGNDEIEGQITLEQILAEYDMRTGTMPEIPEEPEVSEEPEISDDNDERGSDENTGLQYEVAVAEEKNREREKEKPAEHTEESSEAIDGDSADSNAAVSGENADENVGTKTQIDLKNELKQFVLRYGDITGLDRQIILKIEDIVKSHDRSGTSSTGNIFVTGDVRSGKSSLAIDLIKLINAIRHRGSRKIAKTNAIILNRQDIGSALNMLESTDIIIEKASSLSDKNVGELISRLREFTGGMIVVFEDERAAMEQMFKIYPEIAEMFANVISIKEFSLTEWADCGRKYALEKGYEIDEMGLLALHSTINKIYSTSGKVEMQDIEEIIDDAIYSANSGIKTAIARLFRRNKNKTRQGEEGQKAYGVLREDDFE